MIDRANSIPTSNLINPIAAIVILITVVLNPIIFLLAKPAFLVAIASAGLFILQAIPFGLLHLNGTPSGWLGVGMAFVYGLMLGSIKRRSQGMLAPFMTHVFADLTIFSMLVILAKKQELF